MVALVGGASLGVNILFSKDATKAAGMIDNELSDARMLSMTRAGEYTFTLDITAAQSTGNKITIDDGDASTPAIVKPIDKNVLITVSNTDGSYSASGDTSIVIIFDKGNGSVKSVDGGTGSGVYQFTVTSGSGSLTKTSVVDLVALTGRHYVEQ